MKNREAIEALRDLLDTTREYPHLDGMTMFGDAIDLAITALEKQEQSCDTCKHRNEHFSGKRCGNCSVGYPDRYEAESNFEATPKNFEAYTEEES